MASCPSFFLLGDYFPTFFYLVRLCIFLSLSWEKWYFHYSIRKLYQKFYRKNILKTGLQSQWEILRWGLLKIPVSGEVFWEKATRGTILSWEQSSCCSVYLFFSVDCVRYSCICSEKYSFVLWGKGRIWTDWTSYMWQFVG